MGRSLATSGAVNGRLWGVFTGRGQRPEAVRRYHGDMLTQGAVDRPGLRSIVWDVAEVGAESSAPVPADVTSDTQV